MTLRRVYFVCRQCRLGGHPLDVRLGITDSTSHHLPRVGTRRGCRQDGLRRKHRWLSTMDRFDSRRVAFRRLADGASTITGSMVAKHEAIAPKDLAVLGQLPGQTSLASRLCPAIGRGTVDWQRPSGGGMQARHWSEVEANGGTLARAPCESDGKSLLSGLQRSLEPLLGSLLNEPP